MDDLISRQAAIDAAWFLHPDDRDALRNTLKELPSAWPEEEIIYCGECKHMMPNGRCEQFADESIRPSASDYCSAGERRTDGSDRKTGGD